MNITPKVVTILTSILRDREKLLADNRTGFDMDWFNGDRVKAAAFRHEVQNARSGAVRWDLAHWLGGVTSSETVMFHRVAKQMEAAGLIERLAIGTWGRGSQRTTHVKLTEAGEVLARKLSESAK